MKANEQYGKFHSRAEVRLIRTLPGPIERDYAWSTPLARVRGRLAAGTRVLLELPVPADTVGEILVVFDPIGATAADNPAPTVEFQP